MIKIVVKNGDGVDFSCFGWVEYLTLVDERDVMSNQDVIQFLEYLDTFESWEFLPRGATIRKTNGDLVIDTANADFPNKVTVVKLYPEIEREIGIKRAADYGGMSFYVRGEYSKKEGRMIAARRAAEHICGESLTFINNDVEESGTLVYYFVADKVL